MRRGMAEYFDQIFLRSQRQNASPASTARKSQVCRSTQYCATPPSGEVSSLEFVDSRFSSSFSMWVLSQKVLVNDSRWGVVPLTLSLTVSVTGVR